MWIEMRSLNYYDNSVSMCVCGCVTACVGCNRAANQSQTIIAYAQPQGIPCVCGSLPLSVCVCEAVVCAGV